jgi:HD superfamily phosphohydrolase
MLIIHDRIHGTIQIDNPFIVDLINSKPMQRLKRISQDGATHYIDPIFNVTRFEHSVGAWYLSKRFNRPIEEQVASLLHDVPHTAFSHVVDHVVDSRNQDYHDQFLKQVVLASEIPAICKKHGIDVMRVLTKEDFYLLDNRTPELSFDRWDYFMRDGYMIGIFPKESIDLILNSAKLGPKGFYFEGVHVAAMFCLLSLAISELVYQGATSYGSYCLLAGALKRGLDTGVISEQDFFGTDDFVWTKLQKASDKQIDAYLSRLQPGKIFELVPEETAEFYGHNKPRYVDPLVKRGRTYIPVSDVVHGLRERVDRFRARSYSTGVTQKIR